MGITKLKDLAREIGVSDYPKYRSDSKDELIKEILKKNKQQKSESKKSASKAASKKSESWNVELVFKHSDNDSLVKHLKKASKKENKRDLTFFIDYDNFSSVKSVKSDGNKITFSVPKKFSTSAAKLKKQIRSKDLNGGFFKLDNEDITLKKVTVE